MVIVRCYVLCIVQEFAGTSGAAGRSSDLLRGPLEALGILISPVY